ncbi:glycosyltransferase involved in cell wall biosynthesis [Flavobacterium sp. 2755]|uniref:glycosyltransferase family 2 protein n=1 Tax=Flavobacterium sp. 2755 TaxID=2817765 RepID=UPI00285F5669|nr:glycosyltransferase family 2 protein [Flavobacterium sp. 2755]MDR6762528.1 glycosyltransferase involved in cell wall biosynthesis [Flavobacterium sp. 2755]
MIAIIIPYYKITFFEKTLESLANQTDKRFKVYIGDDASPKSPVLLLEKYKSKFDFEYYRFETNLGSISLTKQWERCISLSEKEDWIMILGDDDFLDPSVIESWHRNFEKFKDKSNVIRFATKIVLEDSNTISDAYIHPVWESASDSFVRIFKGITRSSLSEYVFSKASYKKYGFNNYPLAWCSDYKAFLDFPDGKLIYTINESIVFFRISNINISGQQENAILKKEVSIRFFRDVIINYLHTFKKDQRLELLMTYEVAIKKDRKPTLKEWFFIMKLYFLNFRLMPFVKSIRRFLISILKK